MPTTVKSAGNGAARTSERPRKIFLLPYAHCDNAWSHTRRWHEDRYTQIFHEVLDIMNRDPDYKWYFDTAYEELSPFARRAPERMAELRRRIQQGRIEVAPNTISNPAFDAVGGETFIRNMVHGRRYFERVFATRTEVYTANDLMPGHSQIPQLLKKGGYRYYRFTRPSLNELVDFYWEGLDGTRILSSRGGYGYGTLADARAFPHDFAEDWPKAANVIYEEIRHRFIVVYRRGKPVYKVQIDYSTLGNAGIVWFSRGGDDCRPLRDLRGQPVDIIGLVQEWNRREEVPLQFATPTEYFTELEQHKEKFPVVSGVLDSSGCACRFGILGNESLFVWWFRDEIAITTAERLACLGSACLDRAYPEQRFDKLWNDLFTTTGHAIRMAFTNDYDRLLERQKRIQRQAQHLSRSTLHALAGRIRHEQAGTPIVIFNSLAWERTDVVVAELEFAAGSTSAIALTDDADRPVPLQITQQELHEDGTLKRAVVEFIATVGSLGYATYYATGTGDPATIPPTQGEEPASAAASVTLGNRYFDVIVGPGGVSSVVLKGSRANLFATGGMAANAISYSTLDGADDFDTLGPFTGEIEQRAMQLVSVERGPVCSRVVTRGAIGAHGIRKEVVIYRDLARIDCTVEIDSKGGDGVFKAKFPLAFAGTMVGPRAVRRRGGGPGQGAVRDQLRERQLPALVLRGTVDRLLLGHGRRRSRAAKRFGADRIRLRPGRERGQARHSQDAHHTHANLLAPHQPAARGQGDAAPALLDLSACGRLAPGAGAPQSLGVPGAAAVHRRQARAPGSGNGAAGGEQPGPGTTGQRGDDRLVPGRRPGGGPDLREPRGALPGRAGVPVRDRRRGRDRLLRGASGRGEGSERRGAAVEFRHGSLGSGDAVHPAGGRRAARRRERRVGLGYL